MKIVHLIDYFQRRLGYKEDPPILRLKVLLELPRENPASDPSSKMKLVLINDLRTVIGENGRKIIGRILSDYHLSKILKTCRMSYG
jgi:hypothetical protein